MRTMVDHARSIGARWSTGTASDLEGGRRRITLEDLVIAAKVLTDLTDEPVTIADLLRTNGRIQFGDGTINIAADTLLDFLAGDTLDEALTRSIAQASDKVMAEWIDLLEVMPPEQTIAEFVAATSAVTEADKRIAKTMAIAPGVLGIWSAHLWGGRMFTDERDRRAGGDASPQKRGRITREMKSELQSAYDAREPRERITEAEALAAWDRFHSSHERNQDDGDD